MTHPNQSTIYRFSECKNNISGPTNIDGHDLRASSLAQTLVSDIKNIMKANYSNPDFSVSDAANALYISHAYMCKVFKTETGITPVSYLINLRLENASRLLHENDYSIKDLADAVGFSDELYFMKRFKKRFGLTVKEYRKQFSSNGE